MKSLTAYLLVLSTLVFIGAGCKSTEVKKTEVSAPQPEPIVQEEKQDAENPATTDEKNDDEVNTQGEVKTDIKTVSPITKPQPTPEKKEETQPKPVVSAVKEFTMVAKNWNFEPSTITVKKGDTVKLHIKSVDVDHGFTLSDFGVSKTLKPGETVTVEFIADKAGNHSFFCSVFCGAGHKEMRGTLIVTE